MRPLGDLIKDEAAMKNFGNTMVAWDLKAMKPTNVMSVPGAPLEIRWSLNPGENWAVTSAAHTGSQVNMISQSWDGKRVYITSSLLANWDEGGADNEQFLRGFAWDGKELKQLFEVDFTREKLGRAHHEAGVEAPAYRLPGVQWPITPGVGRCGSRACACSPGPRPCRSARARRTSPGRPWTSCPRSRERTGFTASCRRPTGRC